MATAEQHVTTAPHRTQVRQYTRAGVFGIWAAAAVPMAALSWIVAPLIARRLDGPNALTSAAIAALTAGMVWQFVLVLTMVRREQGSLRWSVLKDALWLRAPQQPRTGRRGGRLWWLLVPLILALAAEEALPAIAHPDNRDFGMFLGSDAGRELLSGNWVWFGIIAAMMIFNTALGEELLFRGLLLPRMSGAFGRWDWVVNGLLFATYHLHVPWVIPQALVDTFILAYPSRRYRSALIGIIVHSAQTIFFLPFVLLLVLK